MKKVGKTLLIAGTVATMAIGTVGMMKITNMQREENRTIIQAYNHTPANILDNVFERDNVKYLPFIYDSPMLADGVTPKTISKTEVLNAFSSRNLEVEISTADIRTGTKISVKGSSDVYTVVIYGDVDCDGVVDAMDAQDVVDCYLNGGTGLSEVCKIAANVENDDDEIDTMDAQRIIDFYLGTETKLVLNEPSHIVENDTTPPVIKFDGQVVTGTQTKTLKVGETFKEPTVTAIDDMDGDVTINIRRTGDTVNTNVVGTYTITYTVSDTKGNTTTVKYVVTVENDVPPTPEVTFDGIRVDGISSLELPILEANYTNVSVTFLKDGQAVDGEITASILRDKNFSIEVPKIKIPGQPTSTNNDAILVEYNQTGKIEQIGFKVANDAIKMMDSNKIKFKIGNQTIAELEVGIKYNTPDKIVIDTSKAEIGKIGNTYIAKKDQVVVLGVIKPINKGDRPLLIENIIGNTAKNGIAIYCNSYDQEGNLLVKIKITDGTKQNYSVGLTGDVDGVVISTDIHDQIDVQAFDVPDNMNITFEDFLTTTEKDKENPVSLKISEDFQENSAIEKIIIKSGANVVNPAISSKYITIKQTVNGVEGEYLKITRAKLTDDGPTAILSEEEAPDCIWIELKDNPQPMENIIITVTYYEGLTGLEKSAQFKVNILPQS